jgi:hypothetical protein
MQPSRNLVQIVQVDGQELNESDLNALQIQFVTQRGPLELSPTRKGCIEIPADVAAGQLQAYLKDTRLATVANLSLPLQNVPRFPLQVALDPDISLRCEAGRLFAVHQLKNPILIQESGAEDVLSVRLEAEDLASGTKYQIAEKNLGDGFLSLQNEAGFNVTHLPEGLFSLHLSMARLNDEFGRHYKKIAQDQSCNLAILKNPPAMDSGIFSRPGFLVVRQGGDWPLRSNLQLNGLRIKACKQPLGSNSDDTLNCEQKARTCSVENNFEDLPVTVPQDLGVFDYFFKVEDQAGNRSKLACQTIGVTGNTPDVSVAWENPAWNLPGAFLQQPQASFAPRIEIARNDHLPADRIRNMLQCRVEFQSQSGMTIRGNDAVCTKGRCEGQTLEEFVPCDDEFRFSIARAWNSPYILNSQLLLSVKVDDGTNEVKIVRRSLGISGARWSMESIDLPAGDTSEINEVIALDAKRMLVLSARKDTNIYDSEKQEWTPAPLNAGAGVQLEDAKLARDTQGQIFATYTISSDTQANDRKLVFSKWQDNAWQELGSTTTATHCRYLLPRPAPDSGAVCLGAVLNTQSRPLHKGLWLLNIDRAEALPTDGLNEFLEAPSEHRIPMSLAADGSAMLINNFRAYWAPSLSGPWQRVLNLLEGTNAPQMSLSQILGTTHEHWLYATNVAEQKVFRLRSASGVAKVEDVAIPFFAKKLPDSFRSMNIDSQGRLRYFAYIWNEGLQQWSLDTSVATAGLSLEAKLDRDIQGIGWFRTEGSFLLDDASTTTFWPVGAYGAIPVQAVMQKTPDDFIFLGMKDGRPARQLYRFHVQPILVLSQKTSGPFQETYPSIWTDSKGRIFSPSIRNGELYVFDEGVWREEYAIVNKTTLNFQEQFLPLSNGGLAVRLGSGLYVKPEPAAPWEQLVGLGAPPPALFPSAAPGDILRAEDLMKLEWIGADAANNIYLADKIYSRILVRRSDGSVSVRPFGDFPGMGSAEVDAEGLVIMTRGQTLIMLDSQLKERRPTPVPFSETLQSIRLKLGVSSSYLKEFTLKKIQGESHQLALCTAWGDVPRVVDFSNVFCVDIGSNGELLDQGRNIVTHQVAGKYGTLSQLLKIGRSAGHHFLYWDDKLLEAPRREKPEPVRAVVEPTHVAQSLGRLTGLESMHVDRFGRVFLGFHGTGILVYDKRGPGIQAL